MVSKAAYLGILLAAFAPVLCGTTFAQGGVSVVINEILASNLSDVRDPQGQHEDWIELYNVGNTPVDLAGYYLTDDLARPTKWQFPAGDPAATKIPARGYLLIWADGDIADSGLHASFRLSAEGEVVALFAPDGLTMLDSLAFGPLEPDVSYGRYPDGAADLRFFGYPTAGWSNLVIYQGVVSPPKFDVGSQICTRPVTVALTTATEGASIYYTTDGTEPFSEARNQPVGSLYTRPVVIGSTVTLKAMAVKAGWRRSLTKAERYVFVGQDVQAFSSPLAIAVVDTFGKGVSRTPVPAYGCFIELEEEGRARMTGPLDFGGAGALNVRGKSSEGFPQRQYHFETQDERGQDKDVSILGLPAESDWVLYGPYTDKSLMRNVLSYRWSNEMGQYAPRTRFIEMFLNTDNSLVTLSDYVGVYVLVEKIKISRNRVDIAKLEPGDIAEPEISGGYIVKKDKFDGDDVSFVTSRGQNLIFQDPNGHDLTQAQRDWIRNYFNAFEAALYGPSFADPVNGYAKFIDVDSFIDTHILVELTKNIDGFRLSTYLYKDRGGKLFQGPAWDYNLSLGNANYLNGWLPTGWYFSQLGDGDYPYWRRLFEDPQFKLRYADRWFALRRDLFATNRLIGMVEDYATLLDEPAGRHFNRWRILGQYVWPNWYIAKTFREEIAWMQTWLANRLAWMDSQIAVEMAPAPPAFNRQGGQVESGFPLTMTGPGAIYYTTDGSDPKPATSSQAVGVVLVSENAPKRVLVPARVVDDAWRGGGAFDDSSWTPTTGGVGYEMSTGYRDYFSLDVQTQMYGKNASCFVRVPFSFARDPATVGQGTLSVRYDDGFIAYLNGVEIARRNFTGEPAWNSVASSLHDDSEAVVFENIEVANLRAVLRKGNNVLAIHAMNSPATSSDFLISVELTASEIPGGTTPLQVLPYTGPVPLAASARVIARSLNGGRWSASNDAVFAVGPVAESVRISEIMYHPTDPNAEFVELTNIGDQSVNLNLVRFCDGIEFTFPSFALAPGSYCLVVQDLAAFETRYGPGLPVAGRYAGALNNAGERIELRDAVGRTIHSFAYRDDWHSSTDGKGFSLTLVSPQTVDPNSLGEKAAWRPSVNRGGSPGAAD